MDFVRRMNCNFQNLPWQIRTFSGKVVVKKKKKRKKLRVLVERQDVRGESRRFADIRYGWKSKPKDAMSSSPFFKKPFVARIFVQKQIYNKINKSQKHNLPLYIFIKTH